MRFVFRAGTGADLPPQRRPYNPSGAARHLPLKGEAWMGVDPLLPTPCSLFPNPFHISLAFTMRNRV